MMIVFVIFTFFTNDVIAQHDYQSRIRRHRAGYKRDLAEVIKEDTSYVSFYDTRDEYRITGTFKALRNQPVFNMATSSGKAKQAQKIGTITFKMNGSTHTLSAYQLIALRSDPKYQEHFFVPFTDQSNGDETYVAGRYLDFELSDLKKGSEIEIDFNKAYNPYCAFVEGYNCPIPPAENQLMVSINAGEKMYGKKRK